VFLKRGPGGAEPVLLDFGMAKLLDACPVTTNSSAVFGTPHYMAPEQALGAGKAGPAADIWSMGVMLFECLSGELPFGRGGPAAAYLARVVYEQAPSLAARCPELPETLSSLVDRALARDADQRFASMADLLAAVRNAAAELGVLLHDPRSGMSRMAPRRSESTRNRWLLVAAVVAVLGVALGGLHTLRAAARNPVQPGATQATLTVSTGTTPAAGASPQVAPQKVLRAELEVSKLQAPQADVSPAAPAKPPPKHGARKRNPARASERAVPSSKPAQPDLPSYMTEDY
jgi:serine/threonine protein kinase